MEQGGTHGRNLRLAHSPRGWGRRPASNLDSITRYRVNTARKPKRTLCWLVGSSGRGCAQQPLSPERQPAKIGVSKSDGACLPGRLTVAPRSLAMKQEDHTVNLIRKGRWTTVTKNNSDGSDPPLFPKKGRLRVRSLEPFRIQDVLSEKTPFRVKTQRICDPQPLSRLGRNHSTRQSIFPSHHLPRTDHHMVLLLLEWSNSRVPLRIEC